MLSVSDYILTAVNVWSGPAICYILVWFLKTVALCLYLFCIQQDFMKGNNTSIRLKEVIC